MRIKTLKVSEKIWHKLKIESAKQKKKMQELTEEILKKYLKK